MHVANDHEREHIALSKWYKHSCVLLSSTLFGIVALYMLKAYKTPVVYAFKERKNELEEACQELKNERCKEMARNQTYTRYLQTHTKRHAALLHYLESIAAILPPDVRLDKFELQNSVLKLKGTALLPKSLTTFFKRLRYEAAQRQDTITEIKKKNNQGKDPSFAITLRITL